MFTGSEHSIVELCIVIDALSSTVKLKFWFGVIIIFELFIMRQEFSFRDIPWLMLISVLVM